MTYWPHHLRSGNQKCILARYRRTSLDVLSVDGFFGLACQAVARSAYTLRSRWPAYAKASASAKATARRAGVTSRRGGLRSESDYRFTGASSRMRGQNATSNTSPIQQRPFDRT
jgi:hypothetical protein